MAATHPCPRCEKLFKTPATLARHQNAKKQCAPVAELRQEARAAAATGLEREVWAARDILRSAGVTGMEALDSIVTLFALREVERLYPRLAQAETFNFVPSSTAKAPIKEAIRAGFVGLSGIARALLHDADPPHQWQNMVRGAVDALAFHPDTAEACQPLYEDTAKMFPVSDSATAHALAKHVHARIPFSAADDTAGQVYMSVVKSMLDGKELGQFFTPTAVVAYLAGRAADGRPLGRVFDPTCGSGGFLAAAARLGAAEVHGCEIDTRVRLLGYFGALAAGAVAPRVRRADFLHGPLVDAPFDTVLANPPFGVKGVDYAELLATFTGADEAEGVAAFPIKSSATGLFLQRIVRSLAVGGRGCVVLPLGKELASRAAAETTLRRALLSAVALREIVVIPSGAFENTSIRTVGIIFDKVRELGDCVERRRRGKGFTVEVRADTPPATAEFRLTQLSAATDGTGYLAAAEPVSDTPETVTLAMIDAAEWSLSPDDYKIAVAAVNMSAYPMARLGDVCSIAIGGTPSTSHAEYYTTVSTGAPWVAISDLTGGLITQTAKRITDAGIRASSVKLVKQGTVLFSFKLSIGKTGIAGMDLYTNEAIAALSTDSTVLAESYLLHVLSNAAVRTSGRSIGIIGSGSLNIKSLAEIEIPLPPLEIQLAIAAELDEQAATAAACDAAEAAAKRLMRITLDNALYKRGFLRALCGSNELAEDVEAVRLGEHFVITKGTVQSSRAVPGEYLFFTGAERPKMHNIATAHGEVLLFVGGAEGSLARTHYVSGGDFAVSDLCYILKPVQSKSLKFLHYWIGDRREEIVAQCKFGIKGTITIERLAKLVIPMPSLEKQNTITLELDVLDNAAKKAAAAASSARYGMHITLTKVLMGPAALPEKEAATSGCASLSADAPELAGDLDDVLDGLLD